MVSSTDSPERVAAAVFQAIQDFRGVDGENSPSSVFNTLNGAHSFTAGGLSPAKCTPAPMELAL